MNTTATNATATAANAANAANAASTLGGTGSATSSAGAVLVTHDLVACPAGTPRHELFVDGHAVPIQ